MSAHDHDVSIEDRLQEVYEKTDSREYAEALDTLDAALAANPDNIYISALRRQLEELLSLSQADELGEDRRHELMEPMPGIIDCAIRDAHRAGRAHGAETPPAPVHEPESGDPQKELEALKLLYFQRASKFVMKGEYEQALAEVRRVFVVDPENTIAKEYASRVEQLISHARQLASEPLPSPSTIEIPESELPAAPPPAEERPHVHTERSTAWDENFVAAAPSPAIPERRMSPPSSRQTVAYGDSLALSLSSARHHAEDDDLEAHAPRRKSRLFLVLAIVMIAPLLAGVAIAVFSPKNAGAAGHSEVAARQEETQKAAVQAQGTIGAPVQSASPQTSPGEQNREEPPGITAANHTSAPPAERQKSEPVRTKPEPLLLSTESESPAPEVPKPAPQKSAPVNIVSPRAAESAPPETRPAVTKAVEAPPPTFVAVQRDPQIVRLEKPEFPQFVWKMGIEGQVIVRVLIDANGKPLDSQILKSTNSVFEQPVVDAVMRSQFSPAQMGQGPVAAWLTIPFRFRQPK